MFFFTISSSQVSVKPYHHKSDTKFNFWVLYPVRSPHSQLPNFTYQGRSTKLGKVSFTGVLFPVSESSLATSSAVGFLSVWAQHHISQHVHSQISGQGKKFSTVVCHCHYPCLLWACNSQNHSRLEQLQGGYRLNAYLVIYIVQVLEHGYHYLNTGWSLPMAVSP